MFSGCKLPFGGANDLCSQWAVPLCILLCGLSSPSPKESGCPGAGCASLWGLTVFLEAPSCCSFRISTDCPTAAATHVLPRRKERRFCFHPGLGVEQASFRICLSAGWWMRALIPCIESISRQSLEGLCFPHKAQEANSSR